MTGMWCVGISAGGAGYPWFGGVTGGVRGTGIGTVGAECVGGQGGMYGGAGTGGRGCEGVRGVAPCCHRYSSSRAVHSQMDVANGPVPEVGRGLGDWIVMSDVTVGLATGYGAVKDAGASLRDGVRRVADLGCISCCRGPMNICEASPEVRSFHGCHPDGMYGVDDETGAKLAGWAPSEIRSKGDEYDWCGSDSGPGAVVDTGFPMVKKTFSVRDVLLGWGMPLSDQGPPGDEWGLRPSRLDWGRMGKGVVHTGPDDRILGQATSGMCGG